MHGGSRKASSSFRCSLKIKIWTLLFIGARGCELEVWGFRDVNEWLFCAALLYSLGRFHQTKLVSLSKSLVYCFCVEDMMPLLLALLLASSKKPEGGHCSVGTTEQCEKLAMQLWVQTPFPLSPWQWPRLYWGLCSSTSIFRGIFLGMEQCEYRFWSKIHIFSISLLLFSGPSSPGNLLLSSRTGRQTH